MDILIIDDDPFKITKIKSVLAEYSLTHVNLEIANTISDGITHLLKQKYDVIILDLNIPLRQGDIPIKDGGLKIIKELKRDPKLLKPLYIIGLTGYSDLKTNCQSFFEIEGWTLLEIDEKSSSWEEAIINKLDHVLNLSLQKNQIMKKILFLSATPINEVRLRVDHECKKIEEEIQRSSGRDRFNFITKFAIDFEDASRAILTTEPDIIHFSGHGNSDGVAFENEVGESKIISKETLVRLFNLYKNSTQCVILNSCDSEALAIEISKLGIYVVGMNSTISDTSAISFSIGFYQALGENKDLMFAFNLGLTHISANNGNTNIPKLWINGREAINS